MSLKTKVEKAFARVISEIEGFPTTTVNIYRGSDFGRHQAPCVLAWCKGGPEEPMGSGNRRMTVTVVIKGNAVSDRKGDGSDLDPVVNFGDLCQIVWAGLKRDDLGALLTAAVEDFHAYDPVVDVGFDPDLAEVSFVEAISFEVYCCGVALTGAV